MKDIALWNEGDWIAAIAFVVLIAFLAIGGMIAASRKPEFLGHPKGLYMLFFAEMWERFSYYGMRALLIFYLTQHWLFSDGSSTLIYGAYTALVYITPVLGGYLADRYLGQRKAVLFGGILLVLGHSFMAVEGTGGQDDPTINVFWLALALIIVGSGFLKANISVMVGQLYRLTDVRRDAAYTIFYMGINAGAAFGVLLAGYLGQTVGWAYGFGLAGLGMLAGLVVFVLGKKALKGAGEPPQPLSKSTELTLYGTGLAAVAVMWALVQYVDVIQTLLIISGVGLLGYVAQPLHRPLRRPRRRAREPVPVDQLDLHHPVRAGLCGTVGAARAQGARAFGPGQVLARAVPGRPRLPDLRVGRQHRRRRRADAGDLRVRDLPAAHDRRAVPVSGRPVGDEPSRPELHGQPGDGRLVLHVGGRQLRCRQDRRGDRRRER